MLPILQIGPLALQTPGFILLAGLWFGLSLAERHVKRFKLTADLLYNMVFVALIFGVVGARLVYVARFPSAFFGNPRSLVSLNTGLLDPSGGIALGFIASLVYGQRKKIPFWQLLDALTPTFVVLIISSCLANLASGNGFGSPTNLPWAIELWGAKRHPSQVYETLAGLVIFMVLWPGRKTVKKLPPGAYFLLFISASSFARLYLEAYRGDSPVLSSGLRITQLLYWCLLAVGLFGLWSFREGHQTNQS